MANILREMQIKTTLRFHFTPVRMSTTVKEVTAYAVEDWQQGEHSFFDGGTVNL